MLIVVAVLAVIGVVRFNEPGNPEATAARDASSLEIRTRPEDGLPNVIGLQVLAAENVLRDAGYSVTYVAEKWPCTVGTPEHRVKYVVKAAGDKVHLTTVCEVDGSISNSEEPEEVMSDTEAEEPSPDTYSGEEANTQVPTAEIPYTYEVRYEALGGAQVEGVYATSLGSVADSWVLSDRWSETVSLDPGNNAYFSLYHKYSNYGRPILCRIYVNGILEAESSTVMGGTANCQVYLP